MDRELLTIQALAAQEVRPPIPIHTPIHTQKPPPSDTNTSNNNQTLPQTRRRFLSNLLAPSDPATASSIRADQFTIQRSLPAPSPLSSANTEPVVVSRGVVDVCESDDSGWYKPETEAALSPSSSPPVSSTKMKGRSSLGSAGTPERTKKGRVSSGRHQQQQTRERRRRWSGAERQDYGTGASF